MADSRLQPWFQATAGSFTNDPYIRTHITPIAVGHGCPPLLSIHPPPEGNHGSFPNDPYIQTHITPITGGHGGPPLHSDHPAPHGHVQRAPTTDHHPTTTGRHGSLPLRDGPPPASPTPTGWVVHPAVATCRPSPEGDHGLLPRHSSVAGPFTNDPYTRTHITTITGGHEGPPPHSHRPAPRAPS